MDDARESGTPRQRAHRLTHGVRQGKEKTMSERFPGVWWYCDRCNASLDEQPGFDDHYDTWTCRECGYRNTISEEDIWPGDRP